jgi:hypothetical protein
MGILNLTDTYPDHDELKRVMTEYKPTESRKFVLRQHEDAWVKWIFPAIFVIVIIAQVLMRTP